MKHFLAYGNSDQAGFRDARVRDSFDYLTVPGTIAAYYPDATAAFVLSSRLKYMIDPRTPLFQGAIGQPKASHYSLAQALGSAVVKRMGDPTTARAVEFDAGLFTHQVIDEMVGSVVTFQRTYGQRAADVRGRLDRYRGLLALATGKVTDVPNDGPAPTFVLAPYFAARSMSDDWWHVNQKIWAACLKLPNPEAISPVIAIEMEGLDALEEAFKRIPRGLGQTCFYWIAGFGERRASPSELRLVWDVVRQTDARIHLVSLYGGFFSVCMSYAGLWGFNNGLGYSESRSWPDLPTTGAAPPRYYVPALHLFQPQGVAQLLIETEPAFACTCQVCAKGRAIVSLTNMQLKAHFALTRNAEIRQVESQPKETVASSLEESSKLLEAVKLKIPSVEINGSYLNRWATVLREATERPQLQVSP